MLAEEAIVVKKQERKEIMRFEQHLQFNRSHKKKIYLETDVN